MEKLAKIKIEIELNHDIDKVWRYFTEPEHIVNWYYASDDWQCPSAINNLSVGSKFNFRMEAKDKSFGFDFEGEYLKVAIHDELEYILSDGRMINIFFKSIDNKVTLTEIFDPDEVNPIEMQREGWLSILRNFKRYIEAGE